MILETIECDTLREHTKTCIFTHVDDTTMVVIARTFEDVVDRLVEAVQTFASKSKDANLKLANKGGIMASSDNLARVITHCLAQVELPFETPAQARDVGVTMASGRTRSEPHMRRRPGIARRPTQQLTIRFLNCLLYTSDAADE